MSAFLVFHTRSYILNQLSFLPATPSRLALQLSKRDRLLKLPSRYYQYKFRPFSFSISEVLSKARCMLQTDQPRQTLQIPLVHLREIVRKKGLYRMWYEKSIQFFKFVHVHSHTPLTRQHLEVTSFKPRANGRNIVGQQLPTLLDVTCCVRLHTQCIVGSCCIRLHTTANKQATIPNIVGATMLRIVASVCTQP